MTHCKPLCILLTPLLVCTTALSSFLIGCREASDRGPLDDRILSILSARTLERPCLGKPGERCLFDLTDREVRGLLKSLRPVRSCNAGEHLPSVPDYALYFQAGKYPMVFYVALGEDTIVYRERQYLYEGGDAASFRQIAGAIEATDRGKPGLIISEDGY